MVEYALWGGASNTTQGVYKIEHRQSRRAYIGSSANIERRWNGHRRTLCNGCHFNPHFQRAWDKYDGGEAFEFSILEVVAETSLLLATEQKYIEEYWDNCYNIAPFAGAPRRGRTFTHTEEAKEKMRVAAMGNQRCLGRVLTEDHKQKIGNANRGKKRPPQSEEQRRATSERMMGNQYGIGHTHTEEWKQAASERMMGKQNALGCTHGEEANRLKSERQTGYKHTPEARQNMSIATKLWWAKKKAREKNKQRLRKATSIWLKKHVRFLSVARLAK